MRHSPDAQEAHGKSQQTLIAPPRLAQTYPNESAGQNGSGRCDLAGQGGRAGHVPALAGASGRDPTAARPDRYRRALVQDRTREQQRIEKLLEDAQIKISSVLSELHGVTARAMMDALIAGQRDPRALAQLAEGRARKKTAQLEEALRGFFTDHHVAILRMMLDRKARIGTPGGHLREPSSARAIASCRTSDQPSTSGRPRVHNRASALRRRRFEILSSRSAGNWT